MLMKKRRLPQGGYSPFSPYQHVTPGGGGRGRRRQRKKSIWGWAAIFGSSSNSHPRGGWQWSAISALAGCTFSLPGAREEAQRARGGAPES